MAPAARWAGGVCNLPRCVGQRLEDPKVEIEELLDRAPAQLLASAKARDQLEHVRLAQREAEREGPEDTEGAGVVGAHVPSCMALATPISWGGQQGAGGRRGAGPSHFGS